MAKWLHGSSLANAAQVAALPTLIGIALIGFGISLWQGHHYRSANLLFGFGVLLAVAAALWFVFVAIALWRCGRSEAPPQAITKSETDGLWAWLHVENTGATDDFQVEVELRDTGEKELPYHATWRDGNRSQCIPQGGQATVNIAEIRYRHVTWRTTDPATLLRFFSAEPSRGYFDRRAHVGLVVGCRVTILREKAGPLPHEHYHLKVDPNEKLIFRKTTAG